MPRNKAKRLGILTGGGDCPGLNAAIRAIVRKSTDLGYQPIGIYEGWRGVLEQRSADLDLDAVSGILRQGGTILRSSRTNPFQDKASERQLWRSLKQLKLHGLLAIGGDDTLGVAAKMADQDYPIIGIPKTIDNDLYGTDLTIGFDTAVSVATEAIDRLQTTAESHNRVIIVEVMGRHAGWIATYAGLAGGADDILIPEQVCTIEDIVATLHHRHQRGKDYSIIVAAEGVSLKLGKQSGLVLHDQGRDAFGHVRLGGVGESLASLIAERTGYDCRAVVLGHLQRGGRPTAFDRVLATRYGVRAVELAHEKKWGRMVAWRQGKITDVSLAKAKRKAKPVDVSVFEVAKTFFG